jgi:hypothetical protein
MVMRGLDLRMTELEQAITPQVDWDDAVIHMSDTMDAHWADSYYAGFMRNMLGATRAFVLDGETDSPMPRGMERAMTRPRPGPLRLLNPPPPNWSPGCAAGNTRNACRATGRVGAGPHGACHGAGPGRGQGVDVERSSDPARQPQADPKPGPLAVAVVAVPLDGPVLVHFGQRYRLADLTILHQPPGDDNLASITLKGSDGATLGWLQWTPRRPGAALLREIALPLAMLLGAFGWGAWIFLREATRITDELIASEARAPCGQP